MQTHIQKWGNSLGLRIPAHLARKLQLHIGSAVTLEIEHGKIVIHPPKYDLETMLKGITQENLHHQQFDDDVRGNEEW